jgi:hypothetical protein
MVNKKVGASGQTGHHHIYMSEERGHGTVREKKSVKINLLIGKN